MTRESSRTEANLCKLISIPNQTYIYLHNIGKLIIKDLIGQDLNIGACTSPYYSFEVYITVLLISQLLE